MDSKPCFLLLLLVLGLGFALKLSSDSSSPFSPSDSSSNPDDKKPQFIRKSVTTSNSSSSTLFELLPKYGFPSGLMPDAVKSFYFSEEDGRRFSVELEKPCYVEFDYLVYYEGNISGVLSYGSIAGLKGVKVRSFFLWLDVDEIKVDLPPNEYVYFEVGLMTKKFDVEQFRLPPKCVDRSRKGIVGTMVSIVLDGLGSIF